MRAIPNLLSEVEALRPDMDPVWGHVWAAEVLGRAIGHELRYWLETTRPGEIESTYLGYGDVIDPALPMTLIRHHIADVL